MVIVNKLDKLNDDEINNINKIVNNVNQQILKLYQFTFIIYKIKKPLKIETFHLYLYINYLFFNLLSISFNKVALSI